MAEKLPSLPSGSGESSDSQPPSQRMPGQRISTDSKEMDGARSEIVSRGSDVKEDQRSSQQREMKVGEERNSGLAGREREGARNGTSKSRDVSKVSPQNVAVVPPKIGIATTDITLSNLLYDNTEIIQFLDQHKDLIDKILKSKRKENSHSELSRSFTNLADSASSSRSQEENRGVFKETLAHRRSVSESNIGNGQNILLRHKNIKSVDSRSRGPKRERTFHTPYNRQTETNKIREIIKEENYESKTAITGSSPEGFQASSVNFQNMQSEFSRLKTTSENRKQTVNIEMKVSEQWEHPFKVPTPIDKSKQGIAKPQKKDLEGKDLSPRKDDLTHPQFQSSSSYPDQGQSVSCDQHGHDQGQSASCDQHSHDQSQSASFDQQQPLDHPSKSTYKEKLKVETSKSALQNKQIFSEDNSPYKGKMSKGNKSQFKGARHKESKPLSSTVRQSQYFQPSVIENTQNIDSLENGKLLEYIGLAVSSKTQTFNPRNTVLGPSSSASRTPHPTAEKVPKTYLRNQCVQAQYPQSQEQVINYPHASKRDVQSNIDPTLASTSNIRAHSQDKDERAFILFPTVHINSKHFQDFKSIHNKPDIQLPTCEQKDNLTKIQIIVNAKNMPLISRMGIARSQFLSVGNNSAMVVPRPLPHGISSLGCIIPYGYALYLMSVDVIQTLSNEKFKFYHFVFLEANYPTDLEESSNTESNPLSLDKYILCYIKASDRNSDFTLVEFNPNLLSGQIHLDEMERCVVMRTQEAEPRDISVPITKLIKLYKDKKLNTDVVNMSQVFVVYDSINNVELYYSGLEHYLPDETLQDQEMHPNISSPSFISVDVNFPKQKKDSVSILLSPRDSPTLVSGSADANSKSNMTMYYSQLQTEQSKESFINFRTTEIDTTVRFAEKSPNKSDFEGEDKENFQNLRFLTQASIIQGCRGRSSQEPSEFQQGNLSSFQGELHQQSSTLSRSIESVLDQQVGINLEKAMQNIEIIIEPTPPLPPSPPQLPPSPPSAPSDQDHSDDNPSVKEGTDFEEQPLDLSFQKEPLDLSFS